MTIDLDAVRKLEELLRALVDRGLLLFAADTLRDLRAEVERLENEYDRVDNVSKALASSHAAVRAERDVALANVATLSEDIGHVRRVLVDTRKALSGDAWENEGTVEAAKRVASEREAALARVKELEAEARKVAEIKSRIIPSNGRIEAALKFARSEFRNDGAEGETVHLLADFVQYARYQFLMSALYETPVIEAAELWHDAAEDITDAAADKTLAAAILLSEAVNTYRARKP